MLNKSFSKAVIIAICFGMHVAGVMGEEVVPPLRFGEVTVSSAKPGNPGSNVLDGQIGDDSRWVSEPSDEPAWLVVDFGETRELAGIHLFSGFGDDAAIESFVVQFWQDGGWVDIPSASVNNNETTALALPFDDTLVVETDKLRLWITRSHQNIARVKELVIWPVEVGDLPSLPEGYEMFAPRRQAHIVPIYLNQSGFDPQGVKRFTVPGVEDGTPFFVRRLGDEEVVYAGETSGFTGDFSGFRPEDTDARYTVEVEGLRSVEFGIGPYWVERVTYQAAMDFMIQSRHYVGDVTSTRRGSFSWRDDHHFAFPVRTLVAQYMSNPSAYDRMPRQIEYVGPDERKTWGTLEPYAEEAPDIVKLIHWGVDVILTQGLTHAMFKGELASFLYAYPLMSEFISESVYLEVLEYALENWEVEIADREYPHDQTPGHNMLALDTKVGTTKGEHPPAHSILPNLYMYAVALRDGLPDPERFFDAAYRQAEWVIGNLDWDDPQTTKGQRMSEHITMIGLVKFAMVYPDRVPAGMGGKLAEWAGVMVGRSSNMWDFRKLSDTQWAPTGEARTAWNEPGNVAGFAACALGVVMATGDGEFRDRLEILAASHMDNVFGRNPLGRHFSYRAPDELEGVEHGWFSYHKGGIGALEDVTFVLDGAPKNEHYPYHPEIGDIGWTEGWVNFNTAYNMSLAMMAAYETKLELFDAEFKQVITAANPGERIGVRLRAPLNFDYEKIEQARVRVGGGSEFVLEEACNNSRYFEGVITVPEDAGGGDQFTVGYGFGWLGVLSGVRVGGHKE